MGGTTFHTEEEGINAKQAFERAVAEAIFEHGHESYSGTIKEKSGFVEIPLPKGKSAYDYANELINKGDRRIDDKWGPAGCILVSSKKVPLSSNIESAKTSDIKPKVTKEVFKGTRQWKTYYVLYANYDSWEGKPKEMGKSEKQDEALTKAKELSAKHKTDIVIVLEKRLVGSKPLIARVTPEVSKTATTTMNKYLFFGWASC